MNQLPISESAVIQRLTRKLAERGERIKVNRSGSKAELSLGRYVVIDSGKAVECHTDDLTSIANKYGVLADNEIIEED
jgi:hypothetical protein